MTPQPGQSTQGHPARAARMAGWLPALLAAVALAGRLVFVLTLGLFQTHYKREAAALVLLATICGALAWLAHREAFARLGRRARLGTLAAAVAAGAGWVLISAWALEPADLIFDSALALVLVVGLAAALWPRPPWPQLALSALTCAMLLVAAEWLLGLRARLEARHPLPDYHDVCLKFPEHPLGAGGTLRPGLDVRVRSPFGPMRWVNNAAGFRSEREFARTPPAGVLRVLYVGDSFTVGYRTDQARTSGAVLERALNDALTTATAGRFRRAEVLIAGSETAIQAAGYVQRHGLVWRPHLVLHGVCLGNDMAQAFLMLRPGSYYDTAQTSAGLAVRENRKGTIGAHAGRATAELMPAEAFRPGWAPLARGLDALATRYGDTRLGQVVQTVPGLSRTPIMFSFAGDGKYRLHVFDLLTGLAFCLKSPPAVIEEAYAAQARALGALGAVCSQGGAGLLVALFPQRYAVSPAEWRATVRRFALDPGRFEPGEPARRMAEACTRAGIPCEDLSEPLRTGGGGDCYMPLGDMHWRDRGHEVVGRALAARVLRLAAGIAVDRH